MASSTPPRWIFRFLSWFCPTALFEEIEGDLIQKFNTDVVERGRMRATLKLITRTFAFFRPGIILRNKIHSSKRSAVLFWHNITIALRQIRRHKVFSAITIFGLAVSMAACLLIFQYASFELSYDRHHPNAENIYRLNLRTYNNGELRSESAAMPVDGLQQIRENIPGIDGSVTFKPTLWWFDCSFTYGHGEQSVTFNEKSVSYSEHSALDIFSYRLTKGDAARALIDPYTAIMSESTAEKYFGTEDPIGKVLHLRGSSDNHEYTVTGVFEDVAANTHFKNNILLSLSSIDGHEFRGSFNGYDYIVINDRTSLEAMQGKLTALAATYPGDPNQRFDVVMEPVTKIHLHSNAEDGATATGDPMMIYFLLGVAFVVLTLAWINYVNLAIARSFSRAREVGVRKTAGATHRQVASQFLTETLVYNIISFVIAAVLVITTARWFYGFVGITFPWNKMYWTELGLTGWIVAVVFCSGILLSGALPAGMMASIPTITVLKGKFQGMRGAVGGRRLSVVFQFVCAIALLMSVIAVNRQFEVMNEKDPGIDFRRTMLVKSPSNADSTFRTKLGQLRTTLQQQSVVDKVFTSASVFVEHEAWLGNIRLHKDLEPEKFLGIIIDPGFIEGYGLKLLAGRNFETADYPGNHFGDKIEPLILNMTGTVRLGFRSPDEAIGATIYWEDNECRVIGVISDFHHRSMKSALAPAFYTANNGPSLSLQLVSGTIENDMSATISTIKKEWDKFFPENAFEYVFLSDVYNNLYSTERQVKNAFSFFCTLAIIISCLGLFALSLFSVTQRAREMSIRKVLGAPAAHLLNLLTREYILMIIVASVTALPFTWLILEQWLSNFALRVHVTTMNLVLPVVLVLVFALVSVGIQTVRVIRRQPAESLKSE
jgi:putative ABC transport system permease protein